MALWNDLHKLFWIENAVMVIILDTWGELARSMLILNLMCALDEGQKKVGVNCLLLMSGSLRSWVGPTSNSLSHKGKLSYVICSKSKASSKSCGSSNSQVLYSGKYDVATRITSVLQIQCAWYCCCLKLLTCNFSSGPTESASSVYLELFYFYIKSAFRQLQWKYNIFPAFLSKSPCF